MTAFPRPGARGGWAQPGSHPLGNLSAWLVSHQVSLVLGLASFTPGVPCVGPNTRARVDWGFTLKVKLHRLRIFSCSSSLVIDGSLPPGAPARWALLPPPPADSPPWRGGEGAQGGTQEERWWLEAWGREERPKAEREVGRCSLDAQGSVPGSRGSDSRRCEE